MVAVRGRRRVDGAGREERRKATRGRSEFGWFSSEFQTIVPGPGLIGSC